MLACQLNRTRQGKRAEDLHIVFLNQKDQQLSQSEIIICITLCNYFYWDWANICTLCLCSTSEAERWNRACPALCKKWIEERCFTEKIVAVLQKEMHKSMMFCMLCGSWHHTPLKPARVIHTVVLDNNSNAMHALAKQNLKNCPSREGKFQFHWELTRTSVVGGLGRERFMRTACPWSL